MNRNCRALLGGTGSGAADVVSACSAAEDGTWSCHMVWACTSGTCPEHLEGRASTPTLGLVTIAKMWTQLESTDSTDCGMSIQWSTRHP